MTIKNLSIGQVHFNSLGLVDKFVGIGDFAVATIYVNRSGKEFALRALTPEGVVRLSDRLVSKLFRLIKEYDKLGKKGLNL